MKALAATLLLLLLLLLQLAHGAATHVSGDILSGSVVWTAANSPYIVDHAPLTVAAGAQLLVQAGVHVLFNTTGAQLTVAGELQILGSADFPVVFDAALPHTASWRGVVFEATAASGTADAGGAYASGSLLRHAVLRGVEEGATAVEMTAHAPYFDSVRVEGRVRGIAPHALVDVLRLRNVSFAGPESALFCEGASLAGLDVDGFEASGCVGACISLDDAFVVAGLSATLRNVALQGGSYGVHATCYDAASAAETLTITGASFAEHTVAAIDISACGRAVEISGDSPSAVIRDGSGSGLRLSDVGTLHVSGLVLRNLTGPSAIEMEDAGSSVLEQCTIEQCAVTDALVRIAPASTYSFSTPGLIELRNNAFTENNASTAVLFWDVSAASPGIFVENSLDGNAVFGGLSCVHFGSDESFVCANNTFVDPLCRFEVEAAGQLRLNGSALEDPHSFDVARNFWGSAVELDVLSRIRDHRNDGSQGLASYLPFLTAIGDLSSLSSETTTVPFVSGSTLRGSATADVSLSISGSPYRVQNSIFIPAGVTLTVEAGVEITVDEGLAIAVAGSLVSLGTSSAPVSISAQSSEFWHGVTFFETSSPTLSGFSWVSGSALFHTTISGAGSGLSDSFSPSLRVDGASALFEFVAIQNSAASSSSVPAAMLSSTATGTLVLRNFSVDSASSDGISVDTAGNVLLENCQVTDSSGAGVVIRNVAAANVTGLSSHGNLVGIRTEEISSLSVANTNVHGNTGNGLVHTGFYVSATLHLTGSLFDGNPVLLESAYCYSSWQIVVTGNVFQNMQQAIPLALPSCQGDQVEIRDNDFLDNSVPQDSQAVLFLDVSSSTLIEGNEFLRNAGGECTVVIKVGSSEVLVQGNTLFGNAAGSNRTLCVKEGTAIVLYENFLNNTENALELAVESNKDLLSPSINATHNFWACSTEDEVSQRIYDNNDDDGLHFVDFWPFLGSANTADVAWDATRSVFLKPGSVISGVLSSDLTLALADSPFTVAASSRIDLGATLTIEAGVVLQFAESASLVVRGALVAGSEGSSSPVQIASAVAGQCWGGIFFSDNATGAQISTPSLAYVSGSALRNVVISGCGNSPSATCLGIAGHAPMLEDISISGCGRGSSILFTSSDPGAHVLLRRVNTTGSPEGLAAGLPLEQDQRAPSVLHLVGCVFSNHSDGCTIGNWNASTIEDTSFLRTSLSVFSASLQSTSLLFEDSHLSGSVSFDGSSLRVVGSAFERSYVEIGTGFHEDANVEITGCLFQGTLESSHPAIRISNYLYEGSSIVLADNVVQDFVTANADVLTLEHNREGATFVLQNNTVLNSRASSRVAFIYSSSSEMSLSRNIFRNNTHSYTSCSWCAALSVSGHVPPLLFENVLYNPLATQELYVEISDATSGGALNATHCFWGPSADSGFIPSRIHDKSDDLDLVEVAFIPFLGSEDWNNVSEAAELPLIGDSCTINAVSVSLPGATISPDGCSSYLVLGRVVVPDGAVLTITAGVKLRFVEGGSLLVEGLLIATDAVFTSEVEAPGSWQGLIFASTTARSQVKNCKIEFGGHSDTEASVTVLKDGVAPLLKSVSILNSSQSGIYITATHSVELLFEDVVVEAEDHAFFIDLYSHPSTGNITLRRCTGRKAYTGFYFGSFDGGSVLLDDCEFKSCYQGASVFGQDNTVVELRDTRFTDCEYGAYIQTAAFSVDGCVFADNEQAGLEYQEYSTFAGKVLSIENNLFQRNKAGAACANFWSSSVSALNIVRNTFSNNQGWRSTLHVELEENIVEISENTFSENTCSDDLCGALAVVASDSSAEAVVHVVGNGFFNNTAAFVAFLDTSAFEGAGKLLVLENEFSENAPSREDALLPVSSGSIAVALKGSAVTLHGNAFTNQLAHFELALLDEGSALINASGNWWGTASAAAIAGAVFDHADDATKSTVDYSAWLASSSKLCVNVNNCSGHGTCIRTDVCLCESGWGGPSCAAFDCSAVFSCNNHGECSGPNTCQCDAGWLQPFCLDADCSGSSNCNSNGLCVGPNTCQCFEGFDPATACAQCLDGRWGSECLVCECLNGGSCTEIGTCACPSNFAGKLCDACAPEHYGSSCLALSGIESIVPSFGSALGGDTVTVFGHNFFNSTAVWKCVFGSAGDVAATWLSEERIQCSSSPANLEGSVVDFNVLENGNLIFNDYKASFSYQGVCTDDVCNGHGFCSLEKCACNAGWTGDLCDQAVVSVSLGPMDNSTAVERTPFTSSAIPVLAGTTPLSWHLVEGPDGASIDNNGVLFWAKPTSPQCEKALRVTVRASNAWSSDTATWFISVTPSYDCTALAEVVRSPENTAVLISGTCKTLAEGLLVADGAVSLWIQLQGVVRTFTATTSASGQFFLQFTPSAHEAGNYAMGAYHPCVIPDLSKPHDTWVLYGADLLPAEVSLSGVLPSSPSSTGEVALRNLGDVALEGIEHVVHGLDGVLYRVDVEHSSRLDALASSYVNITAHSNGAWDGTVAIEFMSSHLPSSVSLQARISFKSASPALEAIPASLDAACPRGDVTFVHFLVKNIGESTTGMLHVYLPQHPDLSLVTPSDFGALLPGESESVTVSVKPQADSQFGTITGSLEVWCDEFIVSVPFSFRIVSLALSNLTILVEDELTYYGPNKSLVSGASVRVTDAVSLSSSFELETGDDGMARFENLPEGSYYIDVQALKHGSRRIFAQVSGQETVVTIFAPLQTVSYIWTVTPTEIEDKYEFVVEATFETHVPFPVVTVDPVLVVVDDLAKSDAQFLFFNITNHGLIAAKNGTLSLPTGDIGSGVRLIPTIDPVGDIPAMTSVIVPVKIERTSGLLRGDSGSGCAAGDFSWEIFCGSSNTYSTGIDFNSGGNSPCGNGGGTTASFGGGGSGGGYHGSGSGNAVTVSPSSISQMECDPCLKEKLECLIGYIPGVGCGYSVYVYAEDTTIFTFIGALAGCLGGPITNTVGCAITIGLCYKNHGMAKRDTEDDLAELYFDTQARRLDNYRRMVLAPLFGIGEAASDGNIDLDGFVEMLNARKADTSELGLFFSASELQELVDNVPAGISSSVASDSLLKHNRTLAYWGKGILSVSDVPSGWSTDFLEYEAFHAMVDTYNQDLATVKREGFDSLGAAFDASVELFLLETGRKREGVCAKVRLQIVQELVLTRTGFEALLVLENTGDEPLLNITVEISIWTAENHTRADHLFAIAAPELTGITSVDGGDMSGHSGNAKWLLVPKQEAAPTSESVRYEVGGAFEYTMNGIRIRNVLWPDTIEVVPSPSLVVSYFWQHDVFSDDPFTAVVEPPVPFYLGLLIHNEGWGTARNMSMSSSQPKIIDNEKGLLVNFTLLGASLNAAPAQTSLQVAIGDVLPQNSTVVLWKMVSTLEGIFMDYNATFTHVGPIGELGVSLVERVDIFELYHVVMLTGTSSGDGIPDFLTNDLPDPWYLPDHVHSSIGGTNSSVAAFRNNTFSEISRAVTSEGATAITFSIAGLPTSIADHAYIRIDDFFELWTDQLELTECRRSDGVLLMLDYNVWRTSRVKHFAGLPDEEEKWLHIFDGADSTGVYTVTYSPRSSCVPQCAGAECGDDGCGGVCGYCRFGLHCSGGVCSGSASALSSGAAGASALSSSGEQQHNKGDEDTKGSSFDPDNIDGTGHIVPVAATIVLLFAAATTMA